MLDAEDVAGVVLMACTQSPNREIIEVQMRTMAESLWPEGEEDGSGLLGAMCAVPSLVNS